MNQTRIASVEHAKQRVSWTLAQLEKLALAFEARGMFLVPALFLPLYLTIAALIARHKLIWDDEFLTLYLSRPASMAQNMASSWSTPISGHGAG